MTSALETNEVLTALRGQVPEWSVVGDSGLEETLVEVPVDYADPGGERISIAVGRIPAADPARRRGVLVAVNGGPGGHNGLGRTMPLRLVGTPLHQVYDLVGFDPRGWGRSAPLMREVVPSTAPWSSRPADEDFPALAADMKAIEEGAARAGGSLRAHITTRNVARDLDIIRATLGEEKVSYLGYAYGTCVGSVYGAMFGERVDRHVLDSCVDPRALWRGQYMTQAVAIRRNVDAWAGWVGEHHSVYGLGADPAAVLASVEDTGEKLAAAPLGGVDRTALDGLVGIGATHRPLWAELATTVVALAAGNYAAVEAAWLLASAEQTRTDPEATLVSGLVETTTAEGEWSSDLEGYYRDIRHYRRHYPYGYGASRAFPWVAAFRAEPARESLPEIARNGYRPGLIVHAEGNSTLSHRGGVAMAARLGHRLVTVADDGSNEVFAVRGHQEVDRTVLDYLINGTLPPNDLILTSAPRPTATARTTPDTDHIKQYFTRYAAAVTV